MEFDKLNFSDGDVLYAKDLMAIVTKIKQIAGNLDTVINSSSSGSEQATYDYGFRYNENFVFAKYLIHYKYVNGMTIEEDTVSHTSGINAMNEAIRAWKLGDSITLEESFQERTADGEFSFTPEQAPKFVRCGTNLQHDDGWYLDAGTLPGQGKGSFEYIKNRDYYLAGRLGWNQGLDINPNDSQFGVNSEGQANNPPTQFEVYSNIDYNNNGGIYKIGDYESYMDGIDPNVAFWGGDMYLIKAVKGTLKSEVTKNGSVEKKEYTNYINIPVAKDNVLMEGFTVIRSSEKTWQDFVKYKTVDEQSVFNEFDFGSLFGETNFNFDRWCRAYFSHPEYYPDPSSGSYRGYIKYFKRYPKTGQEGYDFLQDGNITLNKGDIFVYFKKKENITGTRINPTAKIYIDDIWIDPRDYGWEGDTWQFNACIDFIMYAAHNDLIGSDGNTYRDGDTIPEGVTTIPAWINYYDQAHHLPDGTIIGVKDVTPPAHYATSQGFNNYSYFNDHYHGQQSYISPATNYIYTIPYEEYVYKPDGERFNRFGGDNYEIMAFCANQKIEFKNIQF